MANTKTSTVLTVILAAALALVTGLYVQLNGEYSATVSRYEALYEDYSQLQSRYGELERSYSRLAEDYDRLRGRYEGLNRDYEDLRYRYGELRQAYLNLSLKLNNTLVELKELNYAYGLLERNYSRVSAELDRLRAEYGDLARRYASLSRDYEALSASLERARALIDELAGLVDLAWPLYDEELITGGFNLAYLSPSSRDLYPFYEWLSSIGWYDAYVSVLNSTLMVPHRIGVLFAECGVENAFYSAEYRAIIICYELARRFYWLFADDVGLDGEEAAEAVLGSLDFVFFHELAHALIDIYDLPITGREEDAADQFATVILLDAERVDALIYTSLWFLLEGDRYLSDLYEIPFWDEHSLEPQRYYNIVCWIYGSDPDSYEWIADALGLPGERAGRCSDEYGQFYESWNVLIAPYVVG